MHPTKHNTLPWLVLDLGLLLITPFVLGASSAILFFFLYPLPAILLSFYFIRTKATLRLQKIQQLMRYPFMISRLLILSILVVIFLGADISLPSFSTLFDSKKSTDDSSLLSLIFFSASIVLYGITLFSTYCKYFTYRYARSNTHSASEAVGAFILEFFLFILAYVVVILGLQTFIL